MTDITIKVELSTEDRARVDALLAKLDKLADCQASSQDIAGLCAELVRRINATEPKPTKEPAHQDEAQQMLEALVARESAPTKQETAQEAPETPQDAQEEQTAQTVDPEPEKQAEQAQPADEPKVSLTDIQQLIIRLAQAGKKAEMRTIVHEYGETATKVAQDSPEKLPELFNRLKALAEG